MPGTVSPIELKDAFRRCSQFGFKLLVVGLFGIASREAKAGPEGRFGPEMPLFTPPFEPHFLQVGDFDGDGRIDVALVTNANPIRLSVFFNRGAPTGFEEVPVEMEVSSYGVRTLEVADLDGDRFPDLVIRRTGTSVSYPLQ